MSARENILSTIASNKPISVALPVIDLNCVIAYDDLLTQFIKVLESIGGKAVQLNSYNELRDILNNEKQSGSVIINAVPEAGGVDIVYADSRAKELDQVEKALIRGSSGVAENGAIWIYESDMINRLLPFICQNLILVLEKSSIVPTMHHALKIIDTTAGGFGVFIAGPSKTADIEQSLVIGAHGAKSLLVYIINS